MKYLIANVNENSELEWNIADSKEQVKSFLTVRFGLLFQQKNYDKYRIGKFVKVFEIEPNYQIIGLDVTKPIPMTIILRD